VLVVILSYALYGRRAWFLRQERGRQNGLVAASWLSNLAALGGSVLLG
jgi:hypothetical protein